MSVVLSDRDLTDEQREWIPADETEAIACWPYFHQAEVYGGQLVFTSGSDEPWDWRSLALCARVYPGWAVTLEDGGVLAARPPRAVPVVQPSGPLPFD